MCTHTQEDREGKTLEKTERATHSVMAEIKTEPRHAPPRGGVTDGERSRDLTYHTLKQVVCLLASVTAESVVGACHLKPGNIVLSCNDACLPHLCFGEFISGGNSRW